MGVCLSGPQAAAPPPAPIREAPVDEVARTTSAPKILKAPSAPEVAQGGFSALLGRSVLGKRSSRDTQAKATDAMASPTRRSMERKVTFGDAECRRFQVEHPGLRS
mmetsp:Transcript_71725/g.201238  ORF Transcript_71725/g.201238 Transcript_71725/m.201238 type:complete len:106 (-) Transcript_71725:222-539(-)